MRHNNERERQKVLKRKRLWDHFRWGYMNQPGRLRKAHWLKDGCRFCCFLRYEKYYRHKMWRCLDKKVIQEQLVELVPPYLFDKE